MPCQAGELYFFLGLHAGISVLVSSLLVLRFKLHFLKITIVVRFLPIASHVAVLVH